MQSLPEGIPPQGQLAWVNGIEMYYEIHGEGPPLVLLHYFTGTSKSWEPYIGDLAKEYRLIIPDMRGHGRSTNSATQFTHGQSAQDIFALLDHLQIDRFKGMGLSHGGMTLLEMVTQQPARAEAAIFISTGGQLSEQGRAELRGINAQEGGEWWKGLQQDHVHGDDQIRALFAQARDVADNYEEVNFAPAQLSTITARTLIMGGDRDTVFPVPTLVEMYASIPNAYLWIVPNEGHYNLLWAKQAELVQAALEFLRGDWEAT
jgi:pimeloyl-ACP methyl ester carboxylesterase